MDAASFESVMGECASAAHAWQFPQRRAWSAVWPAAKDDKGASAAIPRLLAVTVGDSVLTIADR